MREINRHIGIIGNDTQLVLARHYSAAYVGIKEDSPDLSRLDLVKKIWQSTIDFSQDDYVLDLGAGRQILERDYIRLNGVPNFRFVTVDIASLKNHQLLERKNGALHVRASGSALPFGENTFSMAVSNMALDFMPDGSIDELYRVVKPESPVYVNLHHPDIIPADLEERMGMKIYSRRTKQVFEFWRYLRDNKILCGSEKEVAEMFCESQFTIESISTKSESRGKWWEVELRA